MSLVSGIRVTGRACGEERTPVVRVAIRTKVENMVFIVRNRDWWEGCETV